jgi:hypothetical protein
MATSDRLNRFASGTVAGTGAAINLVLGFKPKYVRLFNTTTAAQVEWMDGMAQAAGIKTVTAGTQTYITSGGVSDYNSTQFGRGITIGADAALNVNTNPIIWMAMGE